MLRLDRVLRDYRRAGSLDECLALWGFIDGSTVLTKSGHVGFVYAMRGVDREALSEPERQAVVRRIEAGFRVLDERCRVYQYLVKRTIAPIVCAPCTQPIVHEAIQRRAVHLNARRRERFEIRVYVAFLYEATHAVRSIGGVSSLARSSREAALAWLSGQQTFRLLEGELQKAVDTLHAHAKAFEVHLGDLGLTRLGRDEAFRFLRQLVNDEAACAATPSCTYDAHLDYFVADSPVECHRSHLLVGDRIVKVLTMKEPPSHTSADLLRDIAETPGELIACVEWRRLPADRVRRDLQQRRRHFFNRRVSLVNYLSSETRPEEMLVDHSSGAIARQLGEALAEIEVNGHFFGECSLTVVLDGENLTDVQHHAAEVRKALAAHDGVLTDETYNLLNAWLAIVPGNAARNLRRLALLETNAADLSFVFTPDPGETVSAHLQREALAIFETPHRGMYAYNLHVHDVGHTLVLGATGSGKSFLLNFLVTHAQKYDPLTVILDLGHSYRKLAALLQGQYLEIGLGSGDVTINPFALPPTPEHLHFLHAFVRVLLEGRDGYSLSNLEDRELYEAIENLYVLERHQRRLFTLANLLPRALAARLHKWVEGGRYEGLFDNVDDTLTVAPLQVFDFEAMRAYPDLLEPLLFYVLHRVVARITEPDEAGRPKICVIDEAWRFIQHPTLRAYIQEGLKTWRKHNAATMLATQSVEDFASPDLLRTIVESCPTKLLLANPSLDRRHYAELFQLNETELDLLTNLVPRQEFLLKRPELAKVLTLTVDPRSYWIYTNTPIDNVRVAQTFEEYGFAAGLDRLAASM